MHFNRKKRIIFLQRNIKKIITQSIYFPIQIVLRSFSHKVTKAILHLFETKCYFTVHANFKHFMGLINMHSHGRKLWKGNNSHLGYEMYGTCWFIVRDTFSTLALWYNVYHKRNALEIVIHYYYCLNRYFDMFQNIIVYLPTLI